MAEQAESVAVTDEDKACVAFIRGDAYRELKQPEEAEKAYMVLALHHVHFIRLHHSTDRVKHAIQSHIQARAVCLPVESLWLS